MKICLVTTFPPSTGGLSEYGFHLAQELQRNPFLSLTVLADKLPSDHAEPEGFSVLRVLVFRRSREYFQADADAASTPRPMESSSTAPLNGLFAGTANDWLTSAVTQQQRSGLSSRYLNQSHKLEAVFYAPEGDVVELHDTAEYDLQIFDRDKTIHSEHAMVHYVILMTPAADRWVIRQLQAVPAF